MLEKWKFIFMLKSIVIILTSVFINIVHRIRRRPRNKFYSDGQRKTIRRGGFNRAGNFINIIKLLVLKLKD